MCVVCGCVCVFLLPFHRVFCVGFCFVFNLLQFMRPALAPICFAVPSPMFYYARFVLFCLFCFVLFVIVFIFIYLFFVFKNITSKIIYDKAECVYVLVYVCVCFLHLLLFSFPLLVLFSLRVAGFGRMCKCFLFFCLFSLSFYDLL